MLSQLYFVWVFILSLSHLAFGGIVPIENNCSAILHEVRVTDCDQMPCKIQKNREYKVEIDFTPNQNSTTLSVRCDTVYYGQSYRIPEQSICSDLSPEHCPIYNGTMYTYTVKFTVPYIVPSGRYPIRCGFWDQAKSETVCISGVGIIFI